MNAYIRALKFRMLRKRLRDDGMNWLMAVFTCACIVGVVVVLTRFWWWAAGLVIP